MRTWWSWCSFFIQINTFVTHPWIFVCSETGERLHVNNKDVYMPEPWFKFINNAENGVVEVGRQDVIIHYPLRSLRDICLWDLVFLVETKDEIYDLEIPNSLKVELSKYFRQSKRFDPDEDERERSDRFIMWNYFVQTFNANDMTVNKNKCFIRKSFWKFSKNLQNKCSFFNIFIHYFFSFSLLISFFSNIVIIF